MNLQAQRDISRKLKVFQHASESGNATFTCRYFGILREACKKQVTFSRSEALYVALGNI